MTDPVPVPTPAPSKSTSDMKDEARDAMLAAVPDAVAALKDLAATATDEKIRKEAADLLLQYGIPNLKGGQRGDLV